MNVLIVSQYFWPENFAINDLAAGLVERGHQVTVLTGKPNYPGGSYYPNYGFWKCNRENFQGVTIRRVPLLSRGKGGSLRLALNYLSFAFFASILGPFFCRGKFHAILVYEPSPITVGLPALLMKKLKGAPVLFWVQDLWPESLSATGAVQSGAVLGIVEKLVRFIYRGCDVILVQSRSFVASIKKFGINEQRILYFPNSAEKLYRQVTLEDSAPEREEMPDGFRIMFAGNIGKAQGFDTILGAADLTRAHTDIHWVILGDGRMLPWVREEVAKRRLEDCVHLLGRRPVETMPRYFALADALLVSLRKDPIFALTIPSKVQAYLACGRPLIAALEGEGARVIREGRAGVTPAADDPEALARAALEMYGKSSSEREEMGINGRRYFESHFERDMLLDRLEGWLKTLQEKGSLCVS